jgi:hypothetical protein
MRANGVDAVFRRRSRAEADSRPVKHGPKPSTLVHAHEMLHKAVQAHGLGPSVEVT